MFLGFIGKPGRRSELTDYLPSPERVRLVSIMKGRLTGVRATTLSFPASVTAYNAWRLSPLFVA